MKTIKLSISLILLLTINSYAQLDKKTWLVGGSGSFNSYKQVTTLTLSNSGLQLEAISSNKKIELSSKIGYFIIDKLVLGITPSFTHFESKPISSSNGSSGYNNDATFSIGPFARYYLLKKEKDYNILSEVNYQIGVLRMGYTESEKGTINKFTILLGPEVYFNSSLGMEILMGYNIYNQKMDNPNIASFKNNGFQVVVGFQLHLEK